jgi:hypothetical protein
MLRAVPGTLSVPTGPFQTKKRPSCLFTPFSSDDLQKKKKLPFDPGFQMFSQIGQKNSNINKPLTTGQDGCPFP